MKSFTLGVIIGHTTITVIAREPEALFSFTISMSIWKEFHNIGRWIYDFHGYCSRA